MHHSTNLPNSVHGSDTATFQEAKDDILIHQEVKWYKQFVINYLAIGIWQRSYYNLMLQSQMNQGINLLPSSNIITLCVKGYKWVLGKGETVCK